MERKSTVVRVSVKQHRMLKARSLKTGMKIESMVAAALRKYLSHNLKV